jgi:hypothetical protein
VDGSERRAAGGLPVSRPRRIQLVAGAVILAVVPFAGAGSAAGAEHCTNYRAVAAADGLRVAYDSPGFVVVEHTDVGFPVAQVATDAFGTATGYAAYPDIGEEVLSLLPVAGVPRDIYPLFIDSQHPSRPEGRFSSPGINLATNTHLNYARAAADSGLGTSSILSSGALVRATAAADCSDLGVVTAQAESTIEGVGLQGLLSIGRVHSIAKVVVDGGEPTVTSDLEISLVTIAGTPVELSASGLQSGASIPIPDLGLNQLLQGLGMQLTYLAPQVQPDGRGVTAPALQLTVSQNISGGAPTVVTLTLGRAFAAADATADDASSEVVPLPEVVPETGTGTDLPIGSIGAPSTPTAPRRATERVGDVLPVSVTGPFSTDGIYAVLAAGALAVLLGGLLFRKLGVKVEWR